MAHPESFDHMLAAWNESDPAKVRAHLDLALSPEVEFIDPSIETHGIDQFEANVHEVHKRLPGAAYSRISGVDSHHRLHRYAWRIARDGEVVLDGFDVAEADDDGMVLRVLGFFGPLPDA
ncbi:MAG: nuclear transport factor 2 family protein [Microthrixaceae bacterium]